MSQQWLGWENLPNCMGWWAAHGGRKVPLGMRCGWKDPVEKIEGAWDVEPDAKPDERKEPDSEVSSEEHAPRTPMRAA